MPPLDDEREDALEILAFFLRLADQDAELVSTYLRSLGFKPGSSFPIDGLLKLALYLRLRLWEMAAVTDGNASLPPSDAVLADLIAQLSGEPVQFETRELCQRLQMFAFQQLAWPQTSGHSPFLLEDQSAATNVLDAVAELLWQFRDLSLDPVEAPGETGPRERIERVRKQ